MALKKTQLLDITSITGIATVGILTVGVTPTAGGVGVASTSYIKNIIMHNTGLGTARVSLYINPDTTPVLGYGVTPTVRIPTVAIPVMEVISNN